MEVKIQAFRALVIGAAANPAFIHHAWFVKYHLEIVERIAEELLLKYPEADSNLVRVLVWLHDYGKILDLEDQNERVALDAREALMGLGFERNFTDRAINYMHQSDQYMDIDLTLAPIEVKIISSSDAAAHHVGPFMQLFWWENPNRPFEELMEGNRRKSLRDWERKMVLPEIRAAFEGRHKMVAEASGEFPDTFLG